MLIPPGQFDMGSNEGEPEESPKHLVRISKPFFLGVCEVTQEEYARIMGNNPSTFRGDLRPCRTSELEPGDGVLPEAQ